MKSVGLGTGAELLGRTRLAAVVIACISLLTQLIQPGNVTKSLTYHRISEVCVLLLGAMLIVTYARGKAQWWDLISLPVLVAIGASGLSNPLSGMSLAIAVVVGVSLYGPTWMWMVRTIGGAAGVLAGVAISPVSLDRPIVWHSASILGMVPQLVLVSVLVRGILVALIRQNQLVAGEAVLARSGREMLAATSAADVREIATRAAADLTAMSPGAVVLGLRQAPDGLTVVTQVGERTATDVRGRVITGPESYRELIPGIRHWRLERIGEDAAILFGGRRPVGDEVVDTYRNLTHQVLLAQASRAAHADLDHRANHDHLTGLPSRAKFFRALADAVDNEPPGTVALFTIDLDDFKRVNDVHGHGAGDELLVEVGMRINALAYSGGASGMAGMPARFGGDEFAMLLTGVRDEARVAELATELCARLVDPIQLSMATVTVGASVGVAVSGSGRTAGDLTRCADIAMYSAKAQGKNRAEVYHPERHGHAAEHLTREKHLAEALERNEIVMRYRPQVDPRTGAPAAVEAYAEWVHPTFGRTDPATLRHLAARTGLLAPLGRHVLRTACALLAGLPGDARIVIDVADRLLRDPSLAENVLAILTGAGFDPARLTLRVSGEQITHRPPKLVALGVRFALDEEGTRVSTLESLRGCPVEVLTAAADDEAGVTMALAVGGVLGAGTLITGVLDAGAGYPDGVIAIRGDAVAPEMDADELTAWLTTDRVSA